MKIYEDIINHFGVRKQMKKFNEETYELLEAIDNFEDLPAVDTSLADINELTDSEISELLRAHIVEEMGDVLILLTQFICKYNIRQEELDTTMNYKLERTINRIKSDYYG